MGMFDDLIPGQSAPAQKGARPSTTGAGFFDDLIPTAAETSGVKPKPVKEPYAPGEEPGYLSNLARGIGERALDVVAGMNDATLGIADSLGFDTEKGFFRDVRRGSEAAKNADLGYRERTSWEDFKNSPIANFIPFALEQGIVSAPDMAFAIANLPGYVYARTGELGDQRAENNGIENATFGDLLATLPAAAASAMLERLGIEKMFGAGEVATQALKQVPKAAGKAALVEAGTEAAQEGIEYTGSNLGTKKGFDPGEAGEQMLAGAVGGAGFGGAIRAGTATGEVLARRKAGTDDLLPDGATRAEDVLDEVEPETVVPVPADRERLGSTRLTDEDRASPIPNDLIDDGKALISGERTPFSRRPLTDAERDARLADIFFEQDIQRAAEGVPLRSGLDPRAMPAAPVEEPDVDINMGEIEERIRQDIEEDGLQSADARPSFLDRLSPEEATAYASAPGVNRAIARRLGVKIDELDAKGDTERADRLRAKLGPILQSFGAGGREAPVRAAPPRARSTAPAASRSTGLRPTGDGSRNAPVTIFTASDLDSIAPRIAAPSDGQAKAGNYAKGHGDWNGLSISVETPKGGTRSGKGPDGSTWEVEMPAHYGDIKGTKGADGDPIDLYMGDDPASDTVFVVDQKDAETGAFDEVKVFGGVNDESDVAAIYEGAFSDGKGGARLQDIHETTVDGLKDWLANGDTTKSFGADQVRTARATLARKPVTTMLRRAGGIDPSSTLAGELRSMGITSRTAPGLFRRGGMGAADNFVREEHELFANGPDDGNGYIPESEILKALRREMAGDPIRTAEEYERERAARPESEDAPRSGAGRGRSQPVADPAAEVGRMIDVYGYPDSPELRQIAEDFIAQGLDPEDAMVAAAERIAEPLIQPAEGASINENAGIPFFTGDPGFDAAPVGRVDGQAEEDGEGVRADQPRDQEGRERGAAGTAGRLGDGPAVDGGEREGSGRAGDARPVEAGADGKPQLVIPGAEAIGQGAQAQRKADAALKAKAPQKDMDVGMFGSGVDQRDLLDLPAAKPKAADAKQDAKPSEAAPAAPELKGYAGQITGRHGYNGRRPTFTKDFAGDRNYPGSVFGDRNRVYLDGDGKWTRGEVDRFSVEKVAPARVTFDNALVFSPQNAAAVLNAMGKKPAGPVPGGKPTAAFPDRTVMPYDEWMAARAKWDADRDVYREKRDAWDAQQVTGKEIAEWAEANGYDGLIATGWDDFAPLTAKWDTPGYAEQYEAREAAFAELGLSDEVGQDQIVAFDPSKVELGQLIDPATPFRSAADQLAGKTDPVAESAPAVPEKPAPVAKPAKAEKPPRTLRHDWGVEDIDGWTEIEGGTNTPTDNGLRGGVKDAFLLDTKNFMQDVAKRLQARGFAPHVDKKGRPDRAVSVNEAGPAVSGEVSLTLDHPESGSGIYAQISHSGRLRIMYRSTTPADKFGARSMNQWGGEDLNAEEFATLLEKTALRGAPKSKPAPAKEEGSNGRTVPLEDDGPGASARVPADPAPRAEGEREAGDMARPARERGAPDNGRADRPRNDRVGSVGDGARAPVADAGTGDGRAGSTGVRDDRRGADGGRGRGRSDFKITAPEEIGAGGQKTKFDNNLRAIELLEELAGSVPTEDQKRELSRYVGWGGIPQAFKRPDGTYAEGWEPRAKKLEATLSKDALAAAKRSTQDAHYTSPQIVSAVWRAAQRLGFKKGRVLEPSVGVGNFLGLRPDGVDARFTAVEYDDTTAAIAKALYGASDVHHQGFQDFSAPDGYFDLAIGNPPFGSQKLFDPKRAHLNNFSIHNMFFAKSVDLLRPDGVLAMVVSNSFLDAVVKDKARRYIAGKAEFLGAIRLPNDAFAKNAGTEVTTDIVFLRKLKDGEATTGESWTDTAYVPDPLGGEDMPLNEYFVRNPDMMLGTFQRSGSMYRAGTTALIAKEGVDMEAALDAAIAKLPRDVMGDWTNEAVERSRAAQVDKTVKVGSMFLDEKGDVAVRGENFGTEARVESAGLTGKALERAKGLIEVRDALTDLRALQLSETADGRFLDEARAELNRAYDAFVKANGPISMDSNRRVFGEDPTWPQLAALEDQFDKGISSDVAKKTGETPRKPSAKKAAIFSKRTQSPYTPPTSAANAKDALTAALSVAGRVDMDLMSRLTNRSEASLFDELSGLLFKTPDGSIVTREDYLSGNVKAKLAAAREAAKRDPSLAGNVSALEAVQPTDIEAADIDAKPGAHWVPGKYVADFINHITGAGGATAIYSRLSGQWSVQLGRVTEAAQVQYGTKDADVASTLRAALEQRAVQIFDQIDRETRVLNQEKSEAATEKARRIADEWRRWIWSDDARRRDLAALYNDQFNTTIPREYDGSHLTFPGKVGDDILKLRPHQANAVWRIVQGGTTLLDHVVGAGKTFTIVAAAMELRRTGFARKPMLVVPNHLVGQWAEDFLRLYPGARVLAATKKDFEAGNRKRLFARVASGDWDAVIVAHSSFSKVELDADFQKTMIDEELADIEDAIKEMKASSAGEKGDDRTVKQAEKQREALKEKLKKLSQSGAKDDNLTFGELGVDALFLDEAHEFKNLSFVTKQRGVMGLGNPTGSQKARDMFEKTQFILRKNGGRNVVHATGTPISNTMAEMYTVGRYLDYDDMRLRGVVHFDAWARQFGEVVTDWEISPSGKYKLTARFAKFVNMPELMQRYATFADVINRDDINRQLKSQGKRLPIPKIKGGKPQNIIVPRSEDQASYIGVPAKDAEGNDTENYPRGSLVWRTENMPKRPEKGADNMLKIMGDARKAALDMRLVDGGYGDNPASKINNAADRIKAIYDRWSAEKGTQLVFIDLSTPKAAKGKEQARIRALIEAAEGRDPEKAEAAQAELDKLSPDEIDALSGDFSVYDDLKVKLISRGIPEAEIAFIHDANTELQKDELFGRVRSGRVRVLFGSTAKMGAGMNVQNRLVALHHMDAPWRPSDLEQREGRIIRQGNELYEADPEGFEVEINRYATERTLDARMWQTIEAKARFIEQVRKGAGGREIEDVGGEAANAAEMKAAASGNPEILEEMNLRKTVRTLENQRREHMREITRSADAIDKLRTFNERLRRDVPLYRADAKTDTKTFAAKIGKKSFEKMGEAADAMAKELAKRVEAGERDGVLGSLFDVPLRFDVAFNGAAPTVSIESLIPHEAQLGMEDSAIGVLMKLRNALNNSEANAEAAEATVERQEKEIAQLEARGAPAWPKEAELQEAKARHEALMVKLRPKAKPKAEAKDATTDVPDDAQAALDGWGSVGGETDQAKLSAEEKAAVNDIIRRVAGLSEAQFRETIQVPTTHSSFKAWGRVGKPGETVGIAGFYSRTRDFIAIALDANTSGARLAYHESFHRIQEMFATDQEKALLVAEVDRVRALVAGTMGRERQAQTMSQMELEAEGFAIYAERKDAGRAAPLTIKGRIRAMWDRIYTVTRRIRNYLNGRGYQTMEDVFDRAYSGEMARRNPDGTFKKVDPSFSLNPEADADIAEAEPQRRTAGFLAKGQPIDRALAATFGLLPGVNLTKDRKWKGGERAFDAVSKAIRTAKFAPDGRMAWMNGVMETARAGLIDRYGLDEAYVARDRARALDERAVMFKGAQVLKSLADQNVSAEEAKVLQAILTGDAVDDAAMQKLAEPIRIAIDELGQEAVQLGLLSAESYERNRGSYLHRVYLKHEQDQNGLQKMVGKIMGNSRRKILGDQLKGRGLFFEVPREAATKNLAEVVKQRREEKKAAEVAERIERLANRRKVAAARLEESQSESAINLARRMDIADAAREQKGGARPYQKGQMREQGVALNRLRKKAEQARRLLARIDAEINAGKAQIAAVEANRLVVGKFMPIKGETYTVLDKRAMVNGKEKTVHRVYIPTRQSVPSAYSDYVSQGTWEVRGAKGDKVILWRDYTKAERGKMGEILDARYTIGKTYMLMAHDLATGRFYKDIAANSEWATKDEPIGASWKNAADVKRLAIDPELQWVKVPDTAIPNTGGKKRWGELSGQFVRAEIWRDLNEIEVMNQPGVWRMLLSQWKLNKTARSPVTHMNNVMSNLMFMDMADVRGRDLIAGIRAYAKGTADYDEAVENGAFGMDMMSQEVRKNVLQPILDELAKSEQGGAENSFLARAGLLGKLADQVWSFAKAADAKMIDAYRIEDEVFRMATYMRRREAGDSPKQAAAVARETFLDYDIRAPWVNVARNSVLPFVSYTYRAAPMVAKMIATRPWKLAKYFAIAYALNALAYAWDDDGDEEKERASLRDEEQGNTWLGVPRMMRMPWRNDDGLPVFLDVRRWMPAGDIVDTNQGSSAIPIPAPLQFGGPILLGFEIALNKQSFTGDEITNREIDTVGEQAAKIGDYLWKSWLPSAAWVPGSWYYSKIANAATGATDAAGRPYDLPSALASSVGVKLKPQDVESGIQWQYRDLKAVETELRAEARRLARQRERGLISQSAFDAGMATYMEKMGRLKEEAADLQRKTSRR